MKFLREGESTKDLEKSVKNKWRWEWLGEKDSLGQKWIDWLKKPDIPGLCFCESCGRTINYKSNGKKAIKRHAEDESHKKSVRVVKSNQVIPGSSKASSLTKGSMYDRVAEQRAVTSAFLSEHCLPFSLAEDLLEYAKRLSQDKTALDKTTISRTSATYINTHGVAKSFKEELKKKLQNKAMSLNIDEATNNNNDKIVNVIVQYFDNDQNKVVLDHLGSRKQNIATASNIMESIESILAEYNIKWNQVISVLMDNCSTMRGVKGGVEAQIRQKNPHLLDISGDTVHMINNVAKCLLNTVDSNVQELCSDLFYDIEESPKVSELFVEIQSLLNIEVPKHLIRPISSRFLQMLDVSNRVMELLDPLTVYYYSFLSEEEREKHSSKVSQIYKDNHVCDKAQAAIEVTQLSQEQQQKSATSNERKDRILSQLFENRCETVTKINLFRGLLGIFQGYVKVFQSEKPLIHTLHRQMFEVTKEVMAMFIKAENIPDFREISIGYQECILI